MPVSKKSELTDLLVRLCETDNFVSSTTEKLLMSGNRDAVYFLLQKSKSFLSQKTDSDLRLEMYKLCLKLELLDEADKFLSEGLTLDGMKESYGWLADLFKRPHYIGLKHKLALKYAEHNAEMVAAIQTLNPVEVIKGNVHGVKALLLVLDLLQILQNKAPAFKLTSNLKEKFVDALSRFLNTDDSI